MSILDSFVPTSAPAMTDEDVAALDAASRVSLPSRAGEPVLVMLPDGIYQIRRRPAVAPGRRGVLVVKRRTGNGWWEVGSRDHDGRLWCCIESRRASLLAVLAVFDEVTK